MNESMNFGSIGFGNVSSGDNSVNNAQEQATEAVQRVAPATAPAAQHRRLQEG